MFPATREKCCSGSRRARGTSNDQTAAVLDGRVVPAAFPVILVFDPQEAARADIPETVWQRIRGGVHGEHDIVMHRPLVPGDEEGPTLA